jgi:hypothetical protein
MVKIGLKLYFYCTNFAQNKVIFRVQEQDETFTILNWNNLRTTPISTIAALFRALEYNEFVQEVFIGKFRK